MSKNGFGAGELPYSIREGILPFRVGDFSEELILINRDIAKILDRQGLYHRIRKTDCFNSATLEGVRRLRKCFRMPDEDIIDEEFCRRLSLELRSMEKIDESEGRSV